MNFFPVVEEKTFSKNHNLQDHQVSKKKTQQHDWCNNSMWRFEEDWVECGEQEYFHYWRIWLQSIPQPCDPIAPQDCMEVYEKRTWSCEDWVLPRIQGCCTTFEGDYQAISSTCGPRELINGHNCIGICIKGLPSWRVKERRWGRIDEVPWSMLEGDKFDSVQEGALEQSRIK